MALLHRLHNFKQYIISFEKLIDYNQIWVAQCSKSRRKVGFEAGFMKPVSGSVVEVI